jgi:hydroxypyruvate isomerase
VAAKLGIPRPNLHSTGLDSRGLPVKPVDVIPGDMWLKVACRYAVREAADTLALVAAVDSPHLRLMQDIYHAQIGEGNLVELIKTCAPYIGEVQVADVPRRCEPGQGRSTLPALPRPTRRRLHRHRRT